MPSSGTNSIGINGIDSNLDRLRSLGLRVSVIASDKFTTSHSVIKKLLAHTGEIIALVKPQFEVDKGQVGKGGIVRDPEKHVRVLREIINFSQDQGLFFLDLTTSPVVDKKKNREFLLYLIQRGKRASQELIDHKIKQQLLFLQHN